MMVLVVSPAAHSRSKKKAVEPTPTLTPTATPTPEVHVWNFDQDKAGSVPAGWKAVEGEWQVIPDPTAPSQPNTFGLTGKGSLDQIDHQRARVLFDGGDDGPA